MAQTEMLVKREAAPAPGKLVAWIETNAGGELLGAFLGETVDSDRLPAAKVCSSPHEARMWVEHEAAKLGLPVEWLPVQARALSRCRD